MERRIHAPIDIWVGFAGGGSTARGGLAARAVAPRVKLQWSGGRRLFDKLKGHDVQAGLEPDRFGFWAVERIIRVRPPRRKRGRQLEVLVRFCGRDPVSKEPWPMEWVSITCLKADLKAQAREMEAALRAAVVVAPMAGRKRSWTGLHWEGADDGGLRRGRSRGAALAGAGGAAGGVHPVVAAPLATAAAAPLAIWRPLPSGGVPGDVPVGMALVVGVADAALARPVALGMAEELDTVASAANSSASGVGVGTLR